MQYSFTPMHIHPSALQGVSDSLTHPPITRAFLGA
jgi:hypothetical protein